MGVTGGGKWVQCSFSCCEVMNSVAFHGKGFYKM